MSNVRYLFCIKHWRDDERERDDPNGDYFIYWASINVNRHK